MEGLRPLFFYAMMSATCHNKYMDKEKLKLIVKNMKSLVNALESEVYSDPDSYKIQLQQGGPQFGFKYDEGDDDGYPD